MKTAWEIARDWYRVEEVKTYIESIRRAKGKEIPEDVYSEEFAEFLTEQYRSAMAKGISMTRRGEEK